VRDSLPPGWFEKGVHGLPMTVGRGWAPTRLFSVGVTWGAPFLCLSFVSVEAVGGAAPQPAAALASASWPLVAAACLAAVVGVTFVARRSVGPVGSPWSLLSWPLTMMIGLALAVAFLESPYEASHVLAYFILMALAAALLVLVGSGIVTSLLTLWRFRHWSAALWVVVWVALVVLFALAELQTGQSFVSGRAALYATGGLLLVSLLAALIAAWLARRRTKAVGLPAVEVSGAEAGTLEPGMRSRVEEQLHRQRTGHT